jgi:hypothetical protein
MASVNKDMLEKLYIIDKKSIPDIAKELGIGYSAARTALQRAGIPLRSRAEGMRAASKKLGKHLLGKTRIFTAEWRENIRAGKLAHGELYAAGVSHKTGGYTEITRGPDKGRGLHVVTMERLIGRRITSDEVVHHIDEDKQNNDLKNLELMTRAEHSRLHALERIKEKQDGKC